MARTGRPPLPVGEAKTDTLRTSVTPKVGAAFRTICKSRGFTVSEALAQAIVLWIRQPKG